MKLPSTNPFGDFRNECKDAVRKSVEKVFPSLPFSEIRLALPPTHEFGDLSSSLCFELAKQLKETPKVLAERMVENIDFSGSSLIRKVEAAGGGYINVYADYSKLSQLTLESARVLDTSYGCVRTNSPLKIIVEHTSVNPAGPIHVGTARNSVLGDSLCRILRARGHEVSANFYIDDVGRQIAVLVYGYQLTSRPPMKEKVDHWLGLVYAITSCVIEIQTLKQSLQRLRKSGASDEEVKKVQSELDDWVAAAADLCERDETLFYELLDRIKQDENPRLSIARIMGSYERGDEETRGVVRKVVELCLAGFRETYGRMNIKWDSWDWESDLVWSSSVKEVVEKLERTRYCSMVDGALELDAERAVKEKNLKSLFRIPEEHEIPSLVLRRSDGTSLYSTRDIAYSMWKLSRADKVINVIGKEQSLAQTQLRIALSVLTSPEKAMNLIHYAYELVKLLGYRMSKRMGRYVTLDEILDEAEKRAWKEVENKSPELPSDVKEEISKTIGEGAVKYALVSIAPAKQVVFSWDKVLNFEMNSAPFIQYAYARASNILKKAGRMPKKIDYSHLQRSAEHELVRKVAVFPEVFIEASENLSPNSFAEFANELAAGFNSFYASNPVLQAESSGLRDARLALVDAVRITLRNSMSLLGIGVLERM